MNSYGLCSCSAVRQCAAVQQCAAVLAKVCGSAHISVRGSAQHCAWWKCISARGAVCGYPAAAACSVW
jgi:hypothetical protein